MIEYRSMKINLTYRRISETCLMYNTILLSLQKFIVRFDVTRKTRRSHSREAIICLSCKYRITDREK